MLSLLVKDLKVVRKRASNRAASFRKRQILKRAASKKVTKPTKLAKKSKNSDPVPLIYEKWPLLRPYDLMQSFASAGLESELYLHLLQHLSKCFW